MAKKKHPLQDFENSMSLRITEFQVFFRDFFEILLVFWNSDRRSIACFDKVKKSNS